MTRDHPKFPPTTYYGRSNFVGLEPFSVPAPTLGAIKAPDLNAACERCKVLLSEFWQYFWQDPLHALPATSSKLATEDSLLMSRLVVRSGGDFKAALEQRAVIQSPENELTHFLLEDCGQPSVFLKYELDTVANKYRELRINCGYANSLHLAVLSREDDQKLYKIMEADTPIHRWLLQSLKSYFQRARPFQTAICSGEIFEVYESASATTPSFPAGHTLQSALQAATLAFTDANWGNHASDMQTWAAGVSDRRVYAGLHFPSDALASWLACVELAKLLWPNLPGENFIQSIAQKSVVVQAIQQSPDEFVVLRTMLDRLHLA